MKTIVMSLAALLCATVMMAQGPRGGMMNATPEERAQKMTQMMKERLQLSDDQAAKLQAVYTDSFKKEKELMDKQRALGEKREADVKALLTPEQLAKFEQDKQQMMQRGQKPQPQPQGKKTPKADKSE